MSASETLEEQCAYCGGVDNLTRDPVPSGAILTATSPEASITVPACPQCHGQSRVKEDDYFRLSLSNRGKPSRQPGGPCTQAVPIRAALASDKVGMLRAFLKTIHLMEQATHGAAFSSNAAGAPLDMPRLNQSVQRTLRGLFYHHHQRVVPAGFETLVFEGNNLDEWPSAEKNYVKMLLKPVLAQPACTLGNGAFSYRFGYDQANPDTTCWNFVFYGRARFIGLTLPLAV
jgi:hypothetical protein